MEENQQNEPRSSANVKTDDSKNAPMRNESTGEPMSQTAQENSSTKGGEAPRQTHENRENPEKDHVPGHMGYNRQEHQIDVNPKLDEE